MPRMPHGSITRRSVLGGATAIAALAAAAPSLRAQPRYAPGTAAGLPARGNVVIRGASVLTMDDSLGDFASGDVHLRDGAIVAVGPRVDAAGATVIEGRGMICMPGIIDTHWHLWTSLMRPFVRADVNE